MTMTYDTLKPIMVEALRLNVIVGPALMAMGTSGLDDGSYEEIETEAKRLVRLLLHGADVLESGNHRIPMSVIEHCIIETLSSTAAYHSQLKLGRMKLDSAMIAVARRLFEKLISDYGPEAVLFLNLIADFYDTLQALDYYGQIAKHDFLTGALHRPWIRYDLAYEWNAMIDHESVEQFLVESTEYIRLTEVGRTYHAELEDFVVSTGYLTYRASLRRLASFSTLENYDEVMESIIPAVEARQRLLVTSGIQPGMRVLELGCGTGGLTVGAGLYKLVGEAGEVIATDPSLGMLNQAKDKASRIGVKNVTFQAMAAEELSFPDNSFDAVTGFAFLHFTKIDEAMNEIYRVLKPGGLFTTILALQFAHTGTLFVDWFKPLLELLPPTAKRDAMPEPDVVPNVMRGKFDISVISNETLTTDYRNPEYVVRFIADVGDVFEHAMIRLPWRAKTDMLELLVKRGQEIVAKYSADEVRPKIPVQFVKAYAMK